jgi:pimeloyl-ACP methyl ester carboxylesterase
MKKVSLVILIGLLINVTTYSQSQTVRTMETSINSTSVVFIHGLFLNSSSWQQWESFFQEKGYTTYAPAYPRHEGEPSALREHAPDSLGMLTFSEVVNHYARFIKTLPEKPILIGHSMGALVAQKLVEMELAEAAVVMSSAPPKGVLTLKFSFAKSNFGLLNPFKGNTVYYPTKKWFHYAFCNTLSRAESDSLFDQFAVPESRNIARETLKKAGKIDFKKPHAPLLFISGEKDHILPASLNKSNFNRYKHESSVRAYKVFEGKDHFLAGSNGWQEVAGYVYEWLTSLQESSKVAKTLVTDAQ